MQAEICEDHPVSDQDEEAHTATEVSVCLAFYFGCRGLMGAVSPLPRPLKKRECYCTCITNQHIHSDTFFFHILLFTNMFQSVCDHHYILLFIYFYHILLFTYMFQSLCNHHQGVIPAYKQYTNSCTKCLIKTACYYS